MGPVNITGEGIPGTSDRDSECKSLRRELPGRGGVEGGGRAGDMDHCDTGLCSERREQNNDALRCWFLQTICC